MRFSKLTGHPSEREYGRYFATPHEGGALVLHHNNKQCVHDSGVELSSKNNGIPLQVGYVAFFGDVEHGVLATESLWPTSILRSYAPEVSLPSLFRKVQSTTAGPECLGRGRFVTRCYILPGGGLIRFGFCHQYPFHHTESQEFIPNILKGDDWAIYNLCLCLGSEPFVRAVYSVRKKIIVMNAIKAQEGLQQEMTRVFIFDDLIHRKGCVFISSGVWDYAINKNEPSVPFADGKFCLISPHFTLELRSPFCGYRLSTIYWLLISRSNHTPHTHWVRIV